MLTPEQIQAFHAEGYLRLPQITTREEVASIREIYDRLFSERCGWDEGNFFDLAGTDTPELPLALPQMLLPSKYEPTLAATQFRRNATIVARQLLGQHARLVFEHAILKPARTGPKTPWHQDEAFYPAGTKYKSLTIWMPLQDVDDENGCMRFIPRSQLGVLHEHRPLHGDPRIHALEAIGVDDAQAICCPLMAGGATVHHYRTLHSAGPNLTEIPRRAYALGFGVFSSKSVVPHEFSWNLDRPTARRRRELESRSPLQRLRDRLSTLKLRLGL